MGGQGPYTYQWYLGEDEIPDADDETLFVSEYMVGSIISVTVTALDGTTATDATDPVIGDVDAPEIVAATVVDAWTLAVQFDEDIIKGEDYALAVTLNSTELEVDEKIDGSTMTITKADGSSFAAGTYTISVLDVEDEFGNVSDELEAEVTKDNSFASGFEAYEGYVSEYDIDHDGNVGNRRIHLTVTDQYGESMNKALSSTYGTIATKAYIKSNKSIIGSTFNKTGEQIDGVDMAYVNLTADKDFKAGETVVIEIKNTISGVTYDSAVEVEILEYDLVQTAQVVTNMEQTTDKGTINKNWVQGENEGSLSLTADNDVFIITTALDSNGNNATKGNIKYVTSDPSVVKVSSANGGTTQYKETALASREFDLDGTIPALRSDDDVFGIWLRGLKAGTATITAYATGNIDAAYTFDVTIEGAELSVGAPIGFIGKRVYFPVENTDGVTQGDLAGVVSTLETEDSDGDRASVATSIALTPYTATTSTTDKKLGLEGGKYYLYSDAFKNFSIQSAYVANVSATAGNFAKSEEVEYYLYPEVTVDGDATAGSGIYLGAQSTVPATAAAVYPTKNGSITAADGAEIGKTAPTTTIGAATYGANNTDLTDKTGGVKGVTYYKAINVVNTAPIRIARFAASQIKYAWSDDTVGTAKVDIIDSFEGATTINTLLENAGTVLLAVTPKSDQVIGTLTVSVGGASADVNVELGNTAAAGSIEIKNADDGKVALIDGATNAAFVDIAANPTGHQLTITLKDQYGDTNVAGNKGLAAVGAGAPGLRLKNATETSNAAAAKVITGELTATLADNTNGTYTVTLSGMSAGAHTLTFYVGKSCTEIGEDDPQYTVEVEFVQKKDITSVEIQSEVEYVYDNGLTGKFADATSEKASDSVKGVNINIGTATKDTVIQPKAKAYVGDKEVSGALFTWKLLDKSIGFTETWNASDDGKTPAGSKNLTIKNGLTSAAFTCDEGAEATHTGAITVNSDAYTNLSVATGPAATAGTVYVNTTYAREDATKGGTWTEANEGVDGLTLDILLKAIKGAKAGEAAEVSGTFHLNATVAGTDKEDEAYVHVSNKGLKISVDDMYLAYGADNETLGVSANEAVGEAIKVKAGDAAGTILRICAVDTAFGGVLYDESAATYTADNTGDGTLIVGTDSATVIANGCDATIANDVITVKADDGTAGKSASLRLPVTTGGKTRFITIPLEIVK